MTTTPVSTQWITQTDLGGGSLDDGKAVVRDDLIYVSPVSKTGDDLKQLLRDWIATVSAGNTIFIENNDGGGSIGYPRVVDSIDDRLDDSGSNEPSLRIFYTDTGFPTQEGQPVSIREFNDYVADNTSGGLDGDPGTWIVIGDYNFPDGGTPPGPGKAWGRSDRTSRFVYANYIDQSGLDNRLDLQQWVYQLPAGTPVTYVFDGVEYAATKSYWGTFDYDAAKPEYRDFTALIAIEDFPVGVPAVSDIFSIKEFTEYLANPSPPIALEWNQTTNSRFHGNAQITGGIIKAHTTDKNGVNTQPIIEAWASTLTLPQLLEFYIDGRSYFIEISQISFINDGGDSGILKCYLYSTSSISASTAYRTGYFTIRELNDFYETWTPQPSAQFEDTDLFVIGRGNSSYTVSYADYVSNVVASDQILISRDSTNYSTPATTLDNITDDDLILVIRNGVSYSTSATNLASSLNLSYGLSIPHESCR